MHPRTLLFIVTLASSSLLAGRSLAADEHTHAHPAAPAAESASGQLIPAREVSADWLKQARAEYPSDQCFVSEEKLEGDMGGPVDYAYREAGKPDRLVRFCCNHCVKDFKKDPAKYLKQIDNAITAKKAGHPHT